MKVTQQRVPSLGFDKEIKQKICKQAQKHCKNYVFFIICTYKSVLNSCNNIMVGCHVCVPCPVVFPQVVRGRMGGLWLWPRLSENNTLVKLGKGKKWFYVHVCIHKWQHTHTHTLHVTIKTHMSCDPKTKLKLLIDYTDMWKWNPH